jgi:hypothetical protein
MKRLTAIGVCLLAAMASCGSSGEVRAPDLPPVPGAVRDGAGHDVDRQDSLSAVFANWDPFVDPEGRPVTYEWSLGTSPGAQDVMHWTYVAGNTFATATGLALTPGGRVFVNVRATDLAGHTSPTASSNGFVAGRGTATPPATSPTTSAQRTGPTSEHATSLMHAGITWTFAQQARVGRFANGDPWVVGPVDVVSIEPGCEVRPNRTRNGSMLDPDPSSSRQGYDSAMHSGNAPDSYDASLNAAADVAPQRPLRLLPGHSLVSTISHAEHGHLPQLRSCAVLTCLADVVSPDTFRPPYCKADKKPHYRARDLDLSVLARLPPVANTPPIAGIAARFEHVWLDHLPGWTSRYQHPSDNMPDYGREIADLVGQAALLLQLDLPDADKLPLILRMVQLGIDLFAVVEGGGSFAADGGAGSGRKFPILLAGALLQDKAMLAIGQRTLSFAEDQQTFLVEETAPGVLNGGQGGYRKDDLGMPEWGIAHALDSTRDSREWAGNQYRRCCTANAWAGSVLAARIMGLRRAWNHDPLFDYQDRYMAIEPKGSWTRCWNRFSEAMWDEYRARF